MTKKDSEELYQERERRFNEAFALKTPDRVPCAPVVGYYGARRQGLTNWEAYWEPERAFPAFVKTILEINPDLAGPPSQLYPAPVAKALGLTQMRFPGLGLADNVVYQFVEGEYMSAEEYDELLSNPGEFALKTLLPRVATIFKFLQDLPPFLILPSAYAALFTSPSIIGNFMGPESGSTIEQLGKAAQELGRNLRERARATEQLKAAGFPILYEVSAFSSFDWVSDFWRGMRGTMLDMRRIPDKLLAAIEMITPLVIASIITGSKKTGNPRVFIPLHRGARAFMSNKDFETFYWPSLKTILEELVKTGIQPMPFFEGDYTPRLEYLAELPKGKVLIHFDRTDAIHAREILGDRLCIKGNVPASLLVTGTSTKVDQWCKNLIEAFDGRGLIMGGAVVGIPDEAKPENVKAMVDACHKYGPAHR